MMNLGKNLMMTVVNWFCYQLLILQPQHILCKGKSSHWQCVPLDGHSISNKPGVSPSRPSYPNWGYSSSKINGVR